MTALHLREDLMTQISSESVNSVTNPQISENSYVFSVA
jgi:hypothetical protein